MRATVRRIDLTQDPAEVEVWPSLSWLADDRASEGHPSGPATAERFTGPQGRSGLWDAMAQAVQRVREVSLAGAAESTEAEVLEFAADAPHLAYLARVACSTERTDGRDELPGAQVIAMVDTRAREAG